MRLWVIAAGFALALSGCDSAQIKGSVVDDFGKVIDGVEVSITNTEFRTKTDNQGRYYLSYVPGRFEVRYAKDDYEPVSIWLEFATRETVRVSSQTLQSKKARRDVVDAFGKAINSLHVRYIEHYRARNQLTANIQVELDRTRSKFLMNIGKTKFGSSFISHVRDFPASVLVLTAPAYIKLGFEPLFIFDGTDRIEIPPDVRAYVDRINKCSGIIDQAMDGTIGLSDPKFLAAAEDCYLPMTGVTITVAGALLGDGTDILVSNDIRKMVADAIAAKTGR